MWRIKSYVEHSLVAITYIFIPYCNIKHSQLAGTGSDLFLNTRYTLVRYISVFGSYLCLYEMKLLILFYSSNRTPGRPGQTQIKEWSFPKAAV